MTAIATAPLPTTGAAAARPPLSPDDLLAMESAGLFELVDGRLVEKRMGYDANWTAGRITTHLSIHLMRTGGGDVLPEQSFRCFVDPDQVRRPDVAFIAAGRTPDPLPPGHVPVVPDLAVEVVSPNDEVDELELKLADYRSAAIPLVWVLIPAVRLVRVFPRGGPNLQLGVGDTLDGGAVLPGFAVAVADLFRPAALTTAHAPAGQ